jgi:hypothetical protein
MNAEELALSFADNEDLYWATVGSTRKAIANLGYKSFLLSESLSKLSHSELAQLSLIVAKLEG